MVGPARRADRTPQRGVPTRIHRLNFVDAQLGKAHLAIDMKTLNFRIVPIPTEVANAARRAAEAGTADHAVIAADSPSSYPCRHCLRWAQVGERVILFPYAAIPPGHPYSETGPIFVHEQPCEHYAATGEYPFTNNRASTTQQQANIRRIFAAGASSALIIQNTT